MSAEENAAPAPAEALRSGSLGTLFLTIFLDLLGFGLVIPFLPGIARRMGANDFVATLPGAVFSVAQFLFIPIWGRLSDRVGRRPVLLWSIGASSIGMAVLGFAPDLTWLFIARIWSGIATGNIAVAQAYIADVTPPEKRARGMAIIGIAFGLGFIFGPFIGGELSRFSIEGRPGMLPPLVAAGLSAINLMMALKTLPESLPKERRGTSVRRLSPIDLHAFRQAVSVPGIGAAVAINFTSYLWFSGMEQTFRLFTADRFAMSDAATGHIFGLVGVVSATVQGAIVPRLVPRTGEARLVRAGLVVQGLAFALLGMSPQLGGASRPALWLSAALIALGSGFQGPTLPAYASRRAAGTAQGTTLGALQSASALARSLGPLVGGALYAAIDPRAPYLIGAVGFGLAVVVAAARLR